MNVHLDLGTHTLPLWFLVLSLFLPRICMLIAWLQHSMTNYIPATVGLIPVIVALLVPRLLILFWIYEDQGIGLWFLIHLIGLLCAWGGGSHRVYSRRTRRVEYVD
jgi:NADH:ubiquinone oxidoreductase subunit 4 (subunit M)